MTDDELVGIADRVVAAAEPGEQVEVVVVHGDETEVKVYDGAVESLASASSSGVGIRVIAGGRQGFAWAGTFEPDAIRDAFAQSRDNARFAGIDEHAGLAEPDGVVHADVRLFAERLERASVDDKVELALELERAALAADRRVAGIESAEYVDAVVRSAVVSTTGIRVVARETACFVAASVLAADGDEVQTGFGYSIGRHLGDLDVGKAAVDAAGRATRMLGARKPPSGRFTLVLDPWVTAQVLAIVGETLCGDAVVKGRSMFADRLGEQVASASVTLVDDPTEAAAFGATAIDGEGLATRRNVLIDRGALAMFVHNAYTARRAGVAPTGSAVRRSFKATPEVGCPALSLVPGHRDQAALVAAVGDGILVQEVAGLHSGVNPVSGDFSTGAEGLRVRNGEVAEPLREFTIASTLQRMLLDIDEVGSDLEWLPMSAAGVSLVLRDVTVSGT